MSPQKCFLVAVTFVLGCGGTQPPPPSPASAPPAGTVRLIVGGDSRNDSSQVLPWSFREAKARGAAAFLFLGDMKLTPSLDAQFRQELEVLKPILFFPVLGNHEIKVFGEFDLGHAQAERQFRKLFLDTPQTPIKSSIDGKVVYSVNLPGHVHFVALDNVSQSGFGPDQLAWLDKDLTQARSDPEVRHVFVGMHKPLAKNGVSTHSMDTDGDQAVRDSEAALDAFERAHVELIFASHVHEFDHFMQRGIRCYITGGLGAPLTSAGPARAYHHFLVVDVAAAEVKVDIVRFDGKPTMAVDDFDD